MDPNLNWTASLICSVPVAVSPPSEYDTGSPINQGTVDRVIFQTTEGHIQELAYTE